MWTYDGTVPGPVQRVRQGVPFQAVVENGLAEDTTVHWHGMRLPNAMDGVPGLTQPPISPGGQFTYAFTPQDAGTFWYHPHANGLEQISRGFAGRADRRGSRAADRSFDTVVTTWPLCSIPDVRQALAEVRRVLRPGGVLLCVEHGQASVPGVARWQDRLDPIWTRLAGGCYLNRPMNVLLSEAGFRLDALSTLRVPGPRTHTFLFEGRARPNG